MKKVITFAAFAFISLAATSAHAQSTISPVPGAPDRPHETSPTVTGNDQITGQMRSDGQTSAARYKKYNSDKMRDAKTSMTAKKEERKEMRMQKKADKAGNM